METLELIQRKQIERLTRRHKMEIELVSDTYPMKLPDADEVIPREIYAFLKKYCKDIRDIEREYSRTLKLLKNVKTLKDLDNMVLPFDWNEKRPQLIAAQGLRYGINQLESYLGKCKESILEQKKES